MPQPANALAAKAMTVTHLTSFDPVPYRFIPAP